MLLLHSQASDSRMLMQPINPHRRYKLVQPIESPTVPRAARSDALQITSLAQLSTRLNALEKNWKLSGRSERTIETMVQQPRTEVLMR